MNRHLSIERLGLLIRADLVARYRLVLITTVTLAILILARGVAGANFTDPSESIFGGWLRGLLFIAGPLVASYSFRELHDKSRNEAYLLLPASALEKTLARLLLATLLLGAYILLFLYVISWLNAAIIFMVYGQRVAVFSLSDFDGHKLLAHALVVQSVFFLGAAWFRKAHAIKTTLMIVVTTVGMFLLTMIIIRMGFGHFSFESIHFDWDLFKKRAVIGVIKNTLELVYFVVLPLFCWWVAWLRVKETQVSHGV